MRRVVAAVIGLAALAALIAATAARVDFQDAMTAAMAPYYGALVASGRGDAESTQRHLVIFAARWAQVGREEATTPPALRDDPAWREALAKVTDLAARARDLVRTRSLEAAHRELEGVRLVLRTVRGRHGLDTLDDWLTDYHESLERIVTRAGMYNEIVLAASDYAELEKDLARALSLWQNVERDAGSRATDPAWQNAAARIAVAHRDLSRQVAGRDARAIDRTAAAMKEAYLDVLAVMARGAR